MVNALYHPDHLLYSNFGAVENRTYRGAVGYREAIADMDEAWSEWRQEIDDLIDSGGNPRRVIFLVCRVREPSAALRKNDV